MAKKDETPGPAASAANVNMLLDHIVELEERLAKMESGQTAVVAKGQTEAEKLTAELDAEYADLAKEFADFSGIQVITRRVEHGTEASNEIRFTDEPTLAEDPTGKERKWAARWFNFSKDGRASEAASKGYERVLVRHLQDPESVAGSVAIDEYVRRGDGGKEMLMRMPAKLYRYIKRREQLAREGKLSSESSTQSYLANQVAAQVGATGGNADQAGTFIQSKGFTVDITEGPVEKDQIPA